MKKVNELPRTASPSTLLSQLQEEYKDRVQRASKVILEIEEFLEAYKQYLAVLQQIQRVLEKEKIK